MLSDRMGIRSAYSIVALLFGLLAATLWWAERRKVQPAVEVEAVE
jgi:hypothetical protein